MTTAYATETQMQATLVDIPDLDDLADMWIDLEPRCDVSYLTSWGWIGTWLKHVPVELRPQALVIEDACGVRGIGLVNRRWVSRRAIIRSHALFLNETGHPTYDELTTEYNGLLVDRECAEAATLAALQSLLDDGQEWDEFFISGIEADSLLERTVRELDDGVECRVLKEHPCFQVSLEALRESGIDFLSTLSGNTRGQIRKAMRLYESQGKLKLESGRDAAESLAFYERLKVLHDARWCARGEPGAFLPFCDTFHRDLIESRFDTGEIQMLRISAGEDEVGYLYNFVYGGRVYNYQSGFTFGDDPKQKPGLVTHALAIQYNLEQGADIYDFMAGDHRHKRSLAVEGKPMRWIVLRRPRLRFSIEDVLRGWKRRCGI